MDAPAIHGRVVDAPVIHKQTGLVIRMFRQKRGLTQAEVAEAIGTSQPALCAIETGARPPRSALSRLAKLFGTTVADLCDKKHAPHAFPAFEAPFYDAALRYEPDGVVMLTTMLAETTAVHVPKLGGKCFALRPPAKVLPLWDKSFYPDNILVFSSQEPKDGEYAYVQTGSPQTASSAQRVNFSAVRRVFAENKDGKEWLRLEGGTPNGQENGVLRSNVLGLWKLVARIRLETDFVKRPDRAATLQRLDREHTAKNAVAVQASPKESKP